MGINRGANIVREGLVYGYDTGYPIVSSSFDFYRFNLGEPTTNIANTDTKRTIVGHNVGGYGHVVEVSSAPEKGDGWKKINITTHGTNYRIAQFPYITHVANTTNTYSVEYDFNELSGYYWKLDGSTGTLGSNIKDTGYIHSLTHTRSSNGSQALFLMNNNVNRASIDDTIYFKNYQIETNPHNSPFTETTRSSTGSLIDITRTTDIDLSNVTFDNNAQITFDGSDDFIELDLNLSDLVGTNPTGITFEFVAKADNLTDPIGISGDYIGPAGTGFGIKRSSSNNKLEFRVYATGGIPRSTTDIPIDSYFYGVCVWDGTGTGELRIYFNGILETTSSTSTTWNHGNGDLRIGDIYGSMGAPGEWQGEIPVFRIYDRALSSSEVTQNFNTLKDRFNI